MKPFNGHPNWSQWNVSLWIANDEGLYRLALAHARRGRTKTEAAKSMLDDLRDLGLEKTPDGARYTKTSILHAMRGLE